MIPTTAQMTAGVRMILSVRDELEAEWAALILTAEATGRNILVTPPVAE